MIKPPINSLVKKVKEEVGFELGNRYSLVLAMAKRARQIAETDEKEKDKEPSTFESRVNDKYKSAKETVKPLHKAIDEFVDDEIEVYQRDPKEVEKERREKYNIKTAPIIIDNDIDFNEEDDDDEIIKE
ncbi:MAG: DNA-directed RNA polymerase subunit omega [Bacillota bacterium]|nr:DNA-directed RNA polymerase subunit omega [Bacillota bacterium]